MRNRQRMVLACLAVLVLAACGAPSGTGEPPSPPAPPTVHATLSPGVRREVVLALPAAPDSLNPLYARSWSARVVRELFLAGLWRLDEELALHPELATVVPTRANGGISADGRTLTIRLRPEATWSDGRSITADDLIFTYEMAVSERNSAVSRFPYAEILSVIALDPHTVQIQFPEPFAPWPSTLFSYVLPRHLLEPVVERDGTLDRAVWNGLPTVGSGPFVFRAREEDELVFEASERYWRGRPAVEQVRVRFLATPAERVAAVTAGQVDLAPVLWPESADLGGLPVGVRLLTGPSGLVETLYLNLDPRVSHPALHQQAVRQAIALALDRGNLCEALQPGHAVPADSLWAGTVFDDPALGPLAVGEAGQLLDGAGWRDLDLDGVRERDGVPLILRYATPAGETDRGLVQELVRQMLGQAGIGVEFVSLQAGQEWDLAEWAEQPPGYPDPDDPRWLCIEARPGGMNRAGVCDARLDELLRAQALTADLDERAALLYRIESLNLEGAWWMPLCHMQDLWLASDQLQNPRPWRGAPFWSAWGW